MACNDLLTVADESASHRFGWAEIKILPLMRNKMVD